MKHVADATGCRDQVDPGPCRRYCMRVRRMKSANDPLEGVRVGWGGGGGGGGTP